MLKDQIYIDNFEKEKVPFNINFMTKTLFMKDLPLFLILIFLSISCSNSKKNVDDNSPNQVTFNIKNDSKGDIILKLKNSINDLSVIIQKDSIYELIGLKDSCKMIHETLNKKYDYLSYQKTDTIPIILIDKSINKILTISDIYPINGLITLNSNNGKTTLEKFIGVYSIK